MRSRASVLLVAGLVAVLGLAACGDDDDDDASSSGTTEPAAEETTTTAPADTTTTAAPEPTEGATIALASTGLGEVLVDAEGFTLYLFTNDTGGTSTCSGGCAETWPAVISDSPSGGDGIDGGLIGTAARDDGSTQVTYNGHPLYRFTPDEAPGDTNGQGVGGVWFAVDATGNAVPA
jgi:predicted lipoprotein with Yx(FWY)xxD motif